MLNKEWHLLQEVLLWEAINTENNLKQHRELLRDLEFYFKCVKCGKDKVSLRLPKVMLFRNLFRLLCSKHVLRLLI